MPSRFILSDACTKIGRIDKDNSCVVKINQDDAYKLAGIFFEGRYGIDFTDEEKAVREFARLIVGSEIKVGRVK